MQAPEPGGPVVAGAGDADRPRPAVGGLFFGCAPASEEAFAGTVGAGRDVVQQPVIRCGGVPIERLRRIGNAVCAAGEREGRGDEWCSGARPPDGPPAHLVPFAVLVRVVDGDAEAGVRYRGDVCSGAPPAAAERCPFRQFELPGGRREQRAATAAPRFVEWFELIPDVFVMPFSCRAEFEAGAADRDHVRR